MHLKDKLELEESLNKVISITRRLILSTPTGSNRNLLSEANIYFEAAHDKVEVLVTEELTNDTSS